MKRKITSLTTAIIVLFLMLITMPGMVWAENENISCANSSPYFTGTNFTISYGKTSGNNSPTYNSTDQGLRLYVNNYLTITPKNGETITAVTLTVKCNKNNNNIYPTSITVNTGNITAGDKPGNNVTSVVWSGSTTSALTFTVNGSAGNVAVKSIAITYTPGTPAYTIIAQSNNESYGTVSLSGSVITGSPKSGYRYANPAYSVSPANSATVSQNGNAFTVTPSANTTVTINFEAIPTHTAHFSINGVIDNNNDCTVSVGAAITFPSPIPAAYGKPFVGWLASTIDGTTNEEPEFVTSATMGENDITYYAVFATVEEGEPQETKIQTMQYDTWSYSGNTTDKSSYRLFGANSYIVSSSTFDLSKLSTVKVYGGTFGGATYCNLTIGDGSNTWKNGSLSGTGNAAEHTFTDGTTLSGTGYLRVTSNSGDGSNNGLRISKVEIFISEPTYTYSAYCTTVTPPAVAQPVITVDNNPFLFSTTATITCETEGAIIKFSYDNETWNNYSSALTITATTTVYAKAIKDANESTVASITITKNLAAPTVTIDASGITNKNVHSGTAAGTLSATVKYNEENIGGASVTWSGDDDDVATINTTTGDITLVAAGSVTFTATYAGNADYSSKTDTYTMNVINYDPSLPTYTLVTNVSDIVPGAHYVIASSKTEGTAYAMDEQNTNYRDRKKISVIQFDKDEDGNDDIFISSDDIYEFVICGDGNNYWTIYDEGQATNHFLAATGASSNNYLNVYGSVEGKSQWSISIDVNSKEVTIVAQITGNDPRNHIRYNNASGQERFSCYKSSNDYPKVYLYKKDNDTQIEFHSDTEIGTNVTVGQNLTLTNTITIENGGVLNMGNNTLSISTGGSLIIEDGGQLITNSSIPLTYKKQITSAAKDGGWYTISTPVHTASNTFLTPGSVENLILDPATNYDFFYYDEASHTWMNYKKSAFNLNIGQGYLYRNNGAELHFAGYSNLATYYEKALSYASSNDKLLGFNLIGNPYPQNITMSDVTVNNEGTLSGGYVLSESGAWSADVAATITPTQGFLVQIDKTGVTARITKPAGGAKSRSDRDYLKFIVANSQYEDAAFALFEEGYGLNKIDHRNSDVPMLYIPKDRDIFAIATMDTSTQSFNLNFKAKTTGKYTLTYEATGELSYLHVIDRLTGEDVDMLLEGEYSFIASPSDNENRFIVNMRYSNNVENSENSIFAYQNGNDIVAIGEGELQIFDVMGRMVGSQRINGVQTINIPLRGVYIFRLNEKTQKIVVE